MKDINLVLIGGMLQCNLDSISRSKDTMNWIEPLLSCTIQWCEWKNKRHLKPRFMVDHYLMVKSPFGVRWPFYPGANEGGHSPFFIPALSYFLCLQWPHFLSYAPIFNCQHWPISHTLPTIRTSSNQPCVPHPIHLQSSPHINLFFPFLSTI